MNPFIHLLWILPLAVSIGFILGLMANAAAANDDVHD